MLVYTNPVLKLQFEWDFNTALDLGIENYSQYKRYWELLLSIAIRNIHPVVIITAGKEDMTYVQVTINKDFFVLLRMFRAECTKNPNREVSTHRKELEDLFYI